MCEPGFRYTCESCHSSKHQTAELRNHTNLHFRKGATLCTQCQSLIALRECPDCNDKYCIQCYDTLHEKGKRKKHVWVPINVLKVDLNKGEEYCIECDVFASTRLCNLCGDGFCDNCFLETHSKGKKISHTWMPWSETLQYGDWVELFDPKTKRQIYYNIETKESVNEKPSVLLSGEERHRVKLAEMARERKKKELERESELIELRDKVKALEDEKELNQKIQIENRILDENPNSYQQKMRTNALSKFFKTKKQIEKEKKERDEQLVISMMMTKRRKETLQKQALSIESEGFAKNIISDIINEDKEESWQS